MIEPHLRNGASFAGMKIGLLGGSFNPAHDGHLAMSLYALKQLGLDQVWWLVSPQNPLKSSDNMALLDQRVDSAAKIAVNPHLIVTAIESKLGTRYTADTLRALKLRFPRVGFVWLMGADNLRQIPQWKHWQDIFHAVPVAVFRRPAYAAGRGLGKAAHRFAKTWRPPTQARLLTRGANTNTGGLLPAWILLDNKLNYTSATKIRRDTPSWQ
jgi:nicotinate-nucleotide adenylyltransferase